LDIEETVRLAGDKEVAQYTTRIEHPYDRKMAEAWISSQPQRYARREEIVFAITLRKDIKLIGAISLALDPGNEMGEMGFWLGKPYWGRGYCTEAARRVLAYAFNELGLNRLEAKHFLSNPASGRVLEKIGLKYEGTLRRRFKKWGVFQDLKVYALLKEEFLLGEVYAR
jgi:RimJ/RimL family protein N-acetyltransferase